MMNNQTKMTKEELILSLYKCMATQFMHDFVSQFKEELHSHIPLYVDQIYSPARFSESERGKAVEGLKIELEKMYPEQLTQLKVIKEELQKLGAW